MEYFASRLAHVVGFTLIGVDETELDVFDEAVTDDLKFDCNLEPIIVQPRGVSTA